LLGLGLVAMGLGVECLGIGLQALWLESSLNHAKNDIGNAFPR